MMFDGSGLSRLNLCSPHQLAQLLWVIHRSDVGNEFESSLALPGEAGTMRTRTMGTLAEKKLKAKTGSMNNVSTLAGYVTTRDGEILCFAIMINNFTSPEALARNLQDLICMRLASFSRRS
jgi:PBP4 family serine-type D-alanyl-D-alanine carboxypeptidase